MYIILSARSSAMVAIWSVTYAAPTLRFIWWHRRYSSTYRNNPLLKIPFLDQPLSHNSHHLSIVPQCSWPRNTWKFENFISLVLFTIIFLFCIYFYNNLIIHQSLCQYMVNYFRNIHMNVSFIQFIIFTLLYFADKEEDRNQIL